MSAEHFPEYHSAIFEVTPPSEDTTAPRTLMLRTLSRAPLSRSRGQLLSLRARQLQQPTLLIFTFNSATRTLLIHVVSYVVRSSDVLNVATTLALEWTITDGSRNHSNNQEHNPSSYEKNLNMQILQLWIFVISAPLITACKVFIHLDLHQIKRSKHRELNL